MDRLNDVARLLVGSWVCASDDPLPADTELLSAAIHHAIAEGAFPSWVKDELHFPETRLGRLCIEVPTILERAQDLELTSAPNPSYTKVKPRVTRDTVRLLLDRVGISREQASTWGLALASGLKKSLEEQSKLKVKTAAG